MTYSLGLHKIRMEGTDHRQSWKDPYIVEDGPTTGCTAAGRRGTLLDCQWAPDTLAGATGRMDFQSPFQPIQEGPERTLPYQSAIGTGDQLREEIQREKRATSEFMARYRISPTSGEERLARDINRLVENFERQQRDLIKRMEEKTALKIHDLLSAHSSWTAARDLYF